MDEKGPSLVLNAAFIDKYLPKALPPSRTKLTLVVEPSDALSRLGEKSPGGQEKVISMGIGLGNGSDPQPPTLDIEGVKELMKNQPISLLVELVEYRYRDRRIKFAAAVLTAALSLVGTSGVLLYEVYVDVPESIEERASAAIEEDARVEYKERQERARTRQQFARTSQSFSNINEFLDVGRQHPVELGVGQRRHYRLNLEEEGGYRIVMDGRASTEPESPQIPFTPVMYLYQLRENEPIARPLGTNIGERTLPFDYETGAEDGTGVWSYFLEVESLLGDAGSFELTVELR